MKRFYRAISSLLLLAIFVAFSSPLLTIAQENYEFVLVNVQTSENGDLHKLKMIKEGEDLFINAGDIPLIVPYESLGSRADRCVVYKRGYKVVEFSIIDKKVGFPNQGFSAEYYGSKRDGNDVYLSLSSILPWLDASAMNNNGNLLITSEPIIIWEVYEDFKNIPDTDFASCFDEDYEATGKTILTAIALDNLKDIATVNVVDTFKKLIPVYSGVSWYDVEVYEECLSSMGVTNPFDDTAAKNVFHASSVLGNIGKIAEKAGVNLAELKVTDEFAKTMIEYGVEAATQIKIDRAVTAIASTYTALGQMKYIKLASEWFNCMTVSMNYPIEYIEAMNLLGEAALEEGNAGICSAVDIVKSNLTKPHIATIKKTIEFGIEEALELGTELSMTSLVVKFADCIAELAFSDQFKAIEDVSKIPAYADVERTAKKIVDEYKQLMPKLIPSKEHQINIARGILISSLATKGSLDAFKTWDKVKGADFSGIDEQIRKCDEVFLKSLICAPSKEYELATHNSHEANMNGMKLWQEEEYYNRYSFSGLNYAQVGATDDGSDIEHNLGPVIAVPEGVCYWEYTSDSYTLKSYGLENNIKAKNKLMLKTSIGTSIITSDFGFGDIAYSSAADRIFFTGYEGDVMMLKSCSIDGFERNVHSPCEQILGVTEDGKYLIFKEAGSSATVSMKTDTFEMTTLFYKEKRFLTCYDQEVYYEDNTNITSENNSRGEVSLRVVNAEGSNDRELHRTKPDLYMDAYHWGASVRHIYINNEYVYFSYGSSDGSADMYQGGKIIRIQKDGQNAEVVAGNDEYVSSDFTVDAAGNINFGEPWAFFKTNDKADVLYEGDSVAPIVGFFNEETGEFEYNITLGIEIPDEHQMFIEFVQVIDNTLYAIVEFALIDYRSGWRGEYIEGEKMLIAQDLSTNVTKVFYQNNYKS